MAAFTPALSTAIDLLARYIVRSLEQKTYASTYHRAPPRNLPRPWTVSVAFRILIADEMNFAPKKIFFSAKMLLFSKNSGLIVASITGASKRGFKRFVPRISTVYPAWFRYLPFQKRENLRCGRKDRKESSGRVQSMDGQRDPENILLERLRVHEPNRCSFA